jgi:hypothetical protein
MNQGKSTKSDQIKPLKKIIADGRQMKTRENKIGSYLCSSAVEPNQTYENSSWPWIEHR